MNEREEFDARVELHKSKIILRRECARQRLLVLSQTIYKEHNFIFIQHLLREMKYEQLENVIGAIDHERRL